MLGPQCTAVCERGGEAWGTAARVTRELSAGNSLEALTGFQHVLAQPAFPGHMGWGGPQQGAQAKTNLLNSPRSGTARARLPGFSTLRPARHTAAPACGWGVGPRRSVCYMLRDAH